MNWYILACAPLGYFPHLFFLLVGQGLICVKDLFADEGGHVSDLQHGEQVVEEGFFRLVDKKLNRNSPVFVVVVVAFGVLHFLLFVLSSFHDCIEEVLRSS